MTNKELDNKLREKGIDPNDPLGFNESNGGKVFNFLIEGLWTYIVLGVVALGIAAQCYNFITNLF